MKVERITFLSALQDEKDIFDSNVDMAVKLDDGHTYVVCSHSKKLIDLNG
jgi:hypothetical protein